MKGELKTLSNFFNPIAEGIKSLWSNSRFSILFLIIPLIYLLNASSVHYMMGAFFLGSVDPEYFYLYNGTIIGSGTLSVQYTAHPGTPLMFLVAISNRILQLVQPGEYMKDVVDDPEKYIHAANLFLNVLAGIVIFLSGYFTRRFSGSVAAALLFQMTVLSSASLMHISGRLIPETMMLIPALLMSLIVVKYVHDERTDHKNIRYIILFSLVAGFGMACKLSFLPAALLPVFLLKTTWTGRISYVLYLALFFAVFAYPVIFNLRNFWEWVAGIFTHSGKYGGGQQQVIDLASVPANIRLLFENDRMFFAIVFVSALIAIIYFLLPDRRGPNPGRKIGRAILSLNLSILIAVAFTLKHFEVYYFIPYYSFKYVLILLVVLLILQLPAVSRMKTYRYLAWALAFAAIILITYSQALKMQGTQAYYTMKKISRETEYKKVSSLMDDNSPLIISGRYYGAPFIEFAHYNGFQMSMHRKGFFTSYLKEKFPKSYLFVDWSDRFYYWNDLVNAGHVMEKSSGTIFVYTGEMKEGDLEVIESRLWSPSEKDLVLKETVYRNESTGEQLVKFSHN
jgi:hypothetical protein